MKIKRRKQSSLIIAVTIAGVVLISALSWVFLVNRQLSRVGVGKEFDLAAAAVQLTQRQTYLEDLRTLEANYQQIAATDIELLSGVLPGAKSVPELLTQLEVMARQSGVNLRRVNMSELREQGVSARARLQQDSANAAAPTLGLKEVLLQMDVDAFDYDSFKTFLTALQNHARVIDISNFFFQTEQEKQTITAKTYYLDAGQ